MKSIQTSDLTFYYKEPAPGKALKTALYFSLSANDSLNLSPFCHPADALLEQGVRVVSVTLPCHENNERPYHIKELWSEKENELKDFLASLEVGVKELSDNFEGPFGAMGLSRGAFIALNLAAHSKHITAVTCFAPLLSIPGKPQLSVLPLTTLLADKNIHFFVGDADTMIGTENVTNLALALQKQSKEEIAVKTYPSIGRGGHGTPDPIFKEGALWLQSKI